MKSKYIIPTFTMVGIGVAYLLYISGKSLLYSSKDFDFSEPFEKGSLEERIDDIDWDSVSG